MINVLGSRFWIGLRCDNVRPKKRRLQWSRQVMTLVFLKGTERKIIFLQCCAEREIECREQIRGIKSKIKKASCLFNGTDGNGVSRWRPKILLVWAEALLCAQERLMPLLEVPPCPVKTLQAYWKATRGGWGTLESREWLQWEKGVAKIWEGVCGREPGCYPVYMWCVSELRKTWWKVSYSVLDILSLRW